MWEGCLFRTVLVFGFICVLPNSLMYSCSQDIVAAVGSAKAPPIRKSELLNGFRVLSVERAESSSVVVNLLVKTGSTFDPPEKEGLAYLTAQAIFFANQKKSAERLKDELEHLEVELKIDVTLDATLFQAKGPRESLEPYLTLLRQMLVMPQFEKRGLDEIKRQAEGSKIDIPNPIELGERYFRAFVFRDHPYGRILSSKSIESIDVSDVIDFYQSQYVPNNSALVVVGTVAHSDAADLAREKMGGWVKGSITEVEFPRMAAKSRFSMLSVSGNIRLGGDIVVVFGQVVPSRLTPDFFSLRILSLILGDLGSASRLFEALRVKNIGYQCLKSKIEFYKAGGQFHVVVRVPQSDVIPALQAISEVMDGIKKTGITEAELRFAKSRLEASYREALSSQMGTADEVVAMELYGLAADFLASFPAKLEQITVDRIAEAAKSYLNPTRASAAIVGDSTGLEAELRKLGPVDMAISPVSKDIRATVSE